MPITCDCLIIGGGIAGVGLAAHLGAERSTVVLEMEDAPGRFPLAKQVGKALKDLMTQMSRGV